MSIDIVIAHEVHSALADSVCKSHLKLSNHDKDATKQSSAKAREACFVNEGVVVTIFLAKLVSTTPRNERLAAVAVPLSIFFDFCGTLPEKMGKIESGASIKKTPAAPCRSKPLVKTQIFIFSNNFRK